ncbi:hypothetical protein CFP56_001965 [Quercus suber]|uniref:RNase H type-1 domain-containing protein n=2 Tax=Quercus suber TaxID=58331 RepID=A0AAW0LGB8_QUESU
MEWKVDRIRCCFSEEDADAILSIPLSLHRPKDRMAATDILATKEALRQRHIEVVGDCAICGNSTENVLHILWFCAHAKNVWNTSKFSLPFDIGPNWSFLDVLDKLQRHEEVQPGGKLGWVTLKNSLGLMDEYQLANEGPRKLAAAVLESIRWVPPIPRQYKVNIDGAVFANQRKVGLGVIICDCNGMVIAALSSLMVGPLGALETETKALETGLHFALDIGIRDAVFESDALEVINAVLGHATSSSSTQFIVDGIHQQACMFRSCFHAH